MPKVKKYSFLTPEGKTINAKIIRGYVAQYITSDYWILAKGYKLFRYNPKSEKISYWTRLNDPRIAFFSRFKLTRRAFRAEITHIYKYGNDWYCIGRKAIFKYNDKTGKFEVCHRVEKGSRPMNLCMDRNGVLYYGEYFYNPSRGPVRIFTSKDGGHIWDVVYTFEEGQINHIHGIFLENHCSNRLWVFTGDDDKACIVGYSDDGFRTFNIQFEGNQKYRVCVPLFFGRKIVYPTDSQYTENTIRSIDLNNKEIKDLQPIQGSGIYAVDTGKICAVSTTVEPSEINLNKESHLWYSFDGLTWKELISFAKDRWKTTVFQFGSIRFPYYETDSDDLVFTGRAVKTLDQSTMIVPIKSIKV